MNQENSPMRAILFSCPKGGVGKTTLSHLLALGAAWMQVTAYLMHTDNRSPLKVNGRPYHYYDARKSKRLEMLMRSAFDKEGIFIIDSGGNRPEFDKHAVKGVDLAIIPVTPDPEAVAMAIEHLKALESYGATNVRFILNMVSSNKFEQRRDFSEYFSNLPEGKIMASISKVAATKRLREPDNEPFSTPPTIVNSLAKNLYFAVQETFQEKNEPNLIKVGAL